VFNIGDALTSGCVLRAMWRFADIRLARMSSGQRCLIRDLGLVKGAKGLRHHELVIELSWRGIVRLATSRIRTLRTNRKLSKPLRLREGTELMAD
jgi:hypothetical protein